MSPDSLASRTSSLGRLLFPGKFVPRPQTRFEHNVLMYVPLPILALFALGLFAPGGLCEYAFAIGHPVLGTLGVLCWLPLLWLLLLELHDAGRVRFWLSAPIVAAGHVALWYLCSGRV